MKIRKNDKVKIISGKDKGKEGIVNLVSKGKVTISGVNVARKHVKPGKVSKEGGIISLEKPVEISNVMVICKKCEKPAKVGFKIVDGKKYRVCKRCGDAL